VYSKYPIYIYIYIYECSERRSVRGSSLPCLSAGYNQGGIGRPLFATRAPRLCAAATRAASAPGRGVPGGIAWADAEKAKLADLNWQVGCEYSRGAEQGTGSKGTTRWECRYRCYCSTKDGITRARQGHHKVIERQPCE
jgi:hypothetical protein